MFALLPRVCAKGGGGAREQHHHSLLLHLFPAPAGVLSRAAFPRLGFTFGRTKGGGVVIDCDEEVPRVKGLGGKGKDA